MWLRIELFMAIESLFFLSIQLERVCYIEIVRMTACADMLPLWIYSLHTSLLGLEVKKIYRNFFFLENFKWDKSRESPSVNKQVNYNLNNEARSIETILIIQTRKLPHICSFHSAWLTFPAMTTTNSQPSGEDDRFFLLFP